MSPAAAAAARSGARVRRALAIRRPTRRLRNRVLALFALCLLLAAGYHFWLRDSSLVRVKEVSVTGATAGDAGRLRAALTSAARTMTTLHVDRARLEQAASAFPVVRGLEVTPDFPNGLQVRVIEHRPAALAITAGGTVPVAADGTILAGLTIKGSLPELHAGGGVDGDRLEDPLALRAARVAGAAPEALRKRLAEVSREPGSGLVALVTDGPKLIFGSSRRLDAKWIAASRVLADPEAEGAGYIDVRLPERPAVGGLGSVTGTTPTIDPATGLAIDPATGLPIDPTTGLPIDPTTGLPIDPATGATTGAAAGTTVDPATGQPIDPATGAPIDPVTGTAPDPATTTAPTAPATPGTGPASVPVDPGTGTAEYPQP